MPRSAYLAVLGAAVLCYAALGAVLRVLPELMLVNLGYVAFPRVRRRDGGDGARRAGVRRQA